MQLKKIFSALPPKEQKEFQDLTSIATSGNATEEERNKALEMIWNLIEYRYERVEKSQDTLKMIALYITRMVIIGVLSYAGARCFIYSIVLNKLD